MQTIEVRIHQEDVHRLLNQNLEYPDVFTIKNIDRNCAVTLEHAIDGVATALEITLHENGTWSARKHVEV